MPNLELAIDDSRLIQDFEDLQSVLGPTNLGKFVDRAGNQILDMAEQIAEDPKRMVAAAVATVSLAAVAPQILPHGNSARNAAPTPHVAPIPARLLAAEKSAAQVVLAKASQPSPAVKLAGPVVDSLKSVASGQSAEPAIITTAAAVTSLASPSQPVTIESLTTVNPIPAQPAETAANQATALQVSANSPAQVATLYKKLQPNATTLLVPPADLPTGGKEIINGQPVSPAVAQANLPAAANSLVVSVDPAQVSAAAVANTQTKPAAPETTTTIKPSPAEHAFDPTNPVDVVYQWLDNYSYGPNKSKLSEKAKFAIMGNLMVEGRMHPGTLQGNVAGFYIPIESLSPATLNSRNFGYGLGQWTPSIKLLNEAQAIGVNPDTVNGQLTVLMNDLLQPDIFIPSQTYLDTIEAAPDLVAATHLMEKHWERPSGDSTTRRYTYAMQIKAFILSNVPLPFTVYPLTATELGTPVPPATTTTTPTTAPTPTTSTTVAATPPTTNPNSNEVDAQWLDQWTQQQTAPSTTVPVPTTGTTTPETATAPVGNPGAVIGPNNVDLESQYNPDYEHLGYGPVADIAQQGCGVVTTKMVISTLNGPISVAAIDQQMNAVDANTGNGTIWSKMAQVLQNNGLNVHEVPASVDSFAQVDQVLRNGGMIILAGTAVDDGPAGAPFTTAGHILAIRGKDANGNYLIADPNSPMTNVGNPDQSYSAEHLIDANVRNQDGQPKLGIFLVSKP